MSSNVCITSKSVLYVSFVIVQPQTMTTSHDRILEFRIKADDMICDAEPWRRLMRHYYALAYAYSEENEGEDCRLTIEINTQQQNDELDDLDEHTAYQI